MQRGSRRGSRGVRKEKGLDEVVRLGGVGVEEGVREVKARAGGLEVFGERYMGKTPKVNISLFPFIHILSSYKFFDLTIHTNSRRRY